MHPGPGGKALAVQIVKAPGRLPHVRKPFAFKKDSTLGPASIADATSLAVHVAGAGALRHNHFGRGWLASVPLVGLAWYLCTPASAKRYWHAHTAGAMILSYFLAFWSRAVANMDRTTGYDRA